jgi:hypothetical protein
MNSFFKYICSLFLTLRCVAKKRRVRHVCHLRKSKKQCTLNLCSQRASCLVLFCLMKTDNQTNEAFFIKKIEAVQCSPIRSSSLVVDREWKKVTSAQHALHSLPVGDHFLELESRLFFVNAENFNTTAICNFPSMSPLFVSSWKPSQLEP